jgi:hypothetical protein
MASTSSSAAGSSEETKFDADGPHKVPMEPAPAAGGSGSMKTAVFGDYDYTAVSSSSFCLSSPCLLLILIDAVTPPGCWAGWSSSFVAVHAPNSLHESSTGAGNFLCQG